MNSSFYRPVILSGTVFSILLGASACNDNSTSSAEAQRNVLTGDEGPEPGRLEGTMAADYPDITLDVAPYAVAKFNAAGNSRTTGNVQFMREEDVGVRVIGRFTDLPQQELELRILQSGDCRDITGLAAAQISAIESAETDTGEADLPEDGLISTLSPGEDGLASIDTHVDQLVLEGEGSIIGKPMIVTSTTTEELSQTAASDLAVIACAVVTVNDITAAENEQDRQ